MLGTEKSKTIVLMSSSLMWLQRYPGRTEPIDVEDFSIIGKTTLTNVLSSFIPDGDRILILEDVAELSIRKPHVISAEAQLDTHKSQIGFADLLKAALGHRPDRIIVGEIRGPEARVFLDALNTGHRGSLTTIHANNAGDALRRLVQLAMRGSGSGVPLRDVEEECGRSINVIVHVMKEDGWRHVTEIRTAARE
jgi:pilus assembly protein CpaF